MTQSLFGRARFARPVVARLLLAAALLATGGAGAQTDGRAQADAFPSRALRILVSIGPGSGSDMMARTLAEQLTRQLGQPVIVENRPGAEGGVAAQALLSAPADGYTLLVISPGTVIINTLTTPPAPYRIADFEPLVGLVRVTGVIAVAPVPRFGTLAEFREQARVEAGRVTMATYGTVYRISAQLLERKLEAQLNHVVYKGFAPATTDLIGGSIDSALIDAGSAAPMIRSGKLRGLAVTSKDRLAILPEVPTLRELGIADFDPPIWVAVALRSPTPEPVARKLEAALQQAMASPAWRELLARQGNLEAWPASSRDLGRTIAADTGFFARAMGAGGN